MIIPLYVNIVSEISDKIKIFDSDDKKKLVKDISKLNEEDSQIFYMLILSYCEEEKINLEEYPFGSIGDHSNITFDFDKFPPKLQNILFSFIQKQKAL